MASKRGVQTELALARLRGLSPALSIWGLSATLANLDEALACLVGAGAHARDAARTGSCAASTPRRSRSSARCRPRSTAFPWAGHIGLKMLPEVIRAIERARSTLVFTNVRSQTEIWYQALLEARPDWAGTIALHHGSLERDVRDWVEAGLRDGRLRAVVCTSSLDLGVDFAPVDQVLQIGSPKGIGRLLQRAGRSGHRPGEISRVTVVPVQALELVEAAAARGAAAARRIEPRTPVVGAQDVLVQHLVTCALGGGFRPDDLRAEVRDTHAYAGLTDADWQWALDFVVHGGASLNAYPEYRRVVIGDDGVAHVPDRQIARRHRMGIGTIVSETSITVAFRNGTKLGQVEESFIAALRPGDCFAFAGRALEFVRVRELTAWVQPAKKTAARVPRWMGGKMALSSELADATRALIAAAKRGVWDAPEMQRVRPLLELQARWSALPGDREWLVEAIATREGHGLFFYPFEGRLAHFGLATLFSYRLARAHARHVQHHRERLRLRPRVAAAGGAVARRAGPAAGRARRRARHPGGTQRDRTRPPPLPRDRARRGPHLPGLPRPAASAAAAAGVERAPLQRVRRVRPRQSAARAGGARSAGAAAGSAAPARRRSRACAGAARCSRRPARPTPFAFPLLVEMFRESLSTEALEARVARMVAELEAAAKAGSEK